MSALIFKWNIFGSLSLLLCFVYEYSKTQGGTKASQTKQIGNK